MLKKTILGGLLSRPTAWSGLALLSAALMASGCGQKGPLFIQPAAPAALPKPATATPAAQPATVPAAADMSQPTNSGASR